MEQDPDSAIPDQDTVEMPSVTPGATPQGAPTQPAQRTDHTRHSTPLEDIVTVPVVAVNPNDPAQADTIIETPAVRSPRVRRPTPPAPVPVEKNSTPARVVRFIWLRYPEFWLIVAVATFLRLWHINLSSFLDDQTALMRLARDAWRLHALPVTSNPSSIGTMNPPTSIYLMLPFTAFGSDPLPTIISIALWNVLGVAFCYIFVHRYFGRLIAASGAVLFASCAVAVNYSRFIWQPNYLAPILVLWIATLYLGCVSGRHGWFVPHVALLTIAILLHATTALLIPVSLLGLLLTPRHARPSWRGWALAIVVVAILLAPTILWEVVSQGSDFSPLVHYEAHRGVLNLDVFRAVYSLLGAPDKYDFGPDALYARIGPWATVVNVAAVFLFMIGVAVLTTRLVRISIYTWHEGTIAATGRTSRLGRGMLAIWRGLHAEPVWRAHLLLWLWVVLPIVLLLRHTGALGTHYLLVLYPAMFIVSGFAIQAAFRVTEKWLPQVDITRQLAPAAILTLLTVLVLGQAVLATLYPATLATGKFRAFVTYGYPLAETQQLNAALTTLQAEQNARTIFLSLPQSPRYRDPLAYLLVGEHASRVGSAADCLVLPAPSEEPALVVATQPAGPANELINNLPTLRPVANLVMAGSDTLPVYQIDGTLPPLVGEQPLTPVTFADAAGSGLRLDALAIEPDGQIRLRWTVVGAATSGQGTPWYRITPAVRSNDGQTHALPTTDCQPTHWHAGETVFTWVASDQIKNGQTLLLQVRGTTHNTTAHAGPLLLLTRRDISTTSVLLHPSSGTVEADGTLALPLASAP